ncbi:MULTISPECIES: hypothetical protein [Bradyrhizobium]|jgi:hypothetical protein|uniref:Uncharacterized protein n=2 Tax=Bradyrhizobium TaxID=374 RepID=A0ABS5GIG3_9BRAD|nr:MULTISPECIES: hypothetical protein [Bradyrhizobium]ABQ36185.1 hypothetical protein BBta_4122 [Bradyrhizobium sp. BTAi1]MBR1141103.1 hypothetical protein [Bradyrhizobium denitrificans]MDU0954401.1 hypothetical protein [Bradyrhizobium sp.]MDU1497795.1 hypothetical protein [Bradyrhizobium sp.]MDU1547579.1 hypothetical protein [Bradyrhizobium sp.]
MSVATEHALATIASILDQQETARQADKPVPPKQAGATVVPFGQADGYTKLGPGPISAIRFRWTVRRGEDGYYVDETVGPASIAVSSGPLSAEAAIKLVDTRAREAEDRFEALKNEMTGRGPAGPVNPLGSR